LTLPVGTLKSVPRGKAVWNANGGFVSVLLTHLFQFRFNSSEPKLFVISWISYRKIFVFSRIFFSVYAIIRLIRISAEFFPQLSVFFRLKMGVSSRVSNPVFTETEKPGNVFQNRKTGFWLPVNPVFRFWILTYKCLITRQYTNSNSVQCPRFNIPFR